MAYYIISFDPERMRQFQGRYHFLDTAVWIRDRAHLLTMLPELVEGAFFFIHSVGSKADLDELVLMLREKAPTVKLIYVTEDGNTQDLKAHQLTPVGGDAYVNSKTESIILANILADFSPPELNKFGSRLEQDMSGTIEISSIHVLEQIKAHPKSIKLDKLFSSIFAAAKKPMWQSAESLNADSNNSDDGPGAPMSDKDKELSLDGLGDLEISLEEMSDSAPQQDGGFELSLTEDIDMNLSEKTNIAIQSPAAGIGELDLELGDDFVLETSAGADAESDELSLSSDEEEGLELVDDEGEDELSLSSDEEEDLSLSLDDDEEDNHLQLVDDEDEDLSIDESLGEESLVLDGLDDDEAMDLSGNEATVVSQLDDEQKSELSLSFSSGDAHVEESDADLSDDALEKLKEIDAIMDLSSSQVGISLEGLDDSLDLSMTDNYGLEEEPQDNNIEESLVSDNLGLDQFDFSSEETLVVNRDEIFKKAKTPKPVKEIEVPVQQVQAPVQEARNLGHDLREISGAYSGEMERVQATISNLRSDREELMAKISRYEEERILQNRHTLTIRAELDEKKIELTIIRKKLNDELNEMKDKLRVHEEKKLILEEKNRILKVELDKAGQKNKIDVKKVQMRESELEQKLELLKSDAETQIRNRDYKILELKRRIDAMEFDMESISVQEKRSVESRYELEDKLDKAIKTLRSAISVLEEDSDKSSALEALKKNIDM